EAITESELRSRLELDTSGQLKEALDFLLIDRAILAEKVGKAALERFPELSKNEDLVKRFYFEIEQYLELIYTSILTQRTNLLRVPSIRQMLPSHKVYTGALDILKSKIPFDLNEMARHTIEQRIDYLKQRIT
ncbi:hypothetical protein, partial [Scytonema sp. PRP1]|uniref:hypothetical protein n=1 Tax=Scytonema sp. PRP1 TaxID=3120513 RepID=UPI00300C78D5